MYWTRSSVSGHDLLVPAGHDPLFPAGPDFLFQIGAGIVLQGLIPQVYISPISPLKAPIAT